jgi:hypothetical protein
MTGIVTALHAVVIMRGYSRICGEISADTHTGTPALLLELLGDRTFVGGVGVGVEEADRDGLDIAIGELATERRWPPGRARWRDARPRCVRRSRTWSLPMGGSGTRSAGRTYRSGAHCE